MAKYCCVCRDDIGRGEKLECVECGKLSHLDCANCYGSEIETTEDWKCPHCSILSAAELESRKKEKVDVKTRFRNVKSWHSRILKRRRDFLCSRKDLLTPFCTEKKISSMIGKANLNQKVKNTSDLDDETDLSIQETPHYIHAELRSYQLEGVSTLCSWAQRGVGGILADEMVITASCIILLFCVIQQSLFRGLAKLFRPLLTYRFWGID